MTLDELFNRDKHATDCQCDACENNRYWKHRQEEGTYVPADNLANHEPHDDLMPQHSHWDN